MAPTPILFASWYTGLGGGETDLLSLVDALDRDRWTSHLLLPQRGKDDQLAQAWRERDLPVHTLRYRGATTYFVPFVWSHFPVVGRMTTLLREQNIALVHSDYHTLPMMYPAAQAAGVPCMWTIHGWWFHPQFWQRDFFREIPAVARSHSIRRGFVGKPPFMPAEQIPVIYSGVDTERFHPSEDGLRIRFETDIAPDAPLVAMVARFQSVKGHRTFQQMAQQVALQVPQARFIVAGEDVFGVAADTQYKLDILEQARNDPLLRNRLHYIGFRHDVERVLGAADVVVCASDFESYGKVNLEAMACGTPVVSTNRGGPSETVIDGETGILVPPKNPAALATAVIELLRQPDERARLGKQGRKHILTTFAAGISAQKYITQFETLLDTS